MTETMTLSDLAHAIEDRENAKLDLIVQPSELAVLPPTEERGSRLIQTGLHPTITPMEISDTAHDQIAGWSPIGRRYYRILKDKEPELWADNVNTWLGAGDPNKPRMLRMQEHESPDSFASQMKLRAFLKFIWDRAPI